MTRTSGNGARDRARAYTLGARVSTALALLVMCAGPAIADGRAATDAPIVGRRDVLETAIAAGAVLGVMSGDEWFRHRALAPRSDGQRRLAADVRWLGDGAVVLPVLAAGYGAARLAHRDAAAASVARAGISTVAAGVVALALKRAIGRSRPSETPDDPHRFDPFSSHDAMPSGHTTIAFALARAVDRECDARWVPWVAYPAAALVGWSRVHDDDHWASDVVAGAAVGLWTASKAEIVLRREAGRGHRIGLRLAPGRAGIALTLGAAP